METKSYRPYDVYPWLIYFIPWLICGMGAVFYSYEYILRVALTAMGPELKQHYSIDDTQLGLIKSVYYWAYVPMQLPVGLLLDRFGARRLLSIACIACAVGIYLFASADSVAWLYAGRIVLGAASAFGFVGVIKLGTMWLSEDKLGLVAGLACALGSLGGYFGQNILGYMVEHMGWQETLHYSGYAGIILAAVMWLIIRDRAPEEILAKKSLEEQFSSVLRDMARILMNRQIWLVGMIGCLIYLPTTILAENYGAAALEEGRHFAKEQAIFASSAIFLGFTIGAPLVGWISDTIHRRRAPLFFGAVSAGIVACIALFVPNLTLWPMTVLFFTLGILYGAQSLVFVIGREISPVHAAGTAVAAINMLVMLGGMLLEPLVGIFLDQIGGEVGANGLVQHTFYDYSLALLLVPVGIFISALLSRFLTETHAVVEETHVTNEKKLAMGRAG
jgi:sugar phosphate permease